MKKYILFILLLISIFVIAKPYLYNPSDRDMLKTSLKDINKKIIVLPEKFLREYDPITIFYTKDQLKEENSQNIPEDYPEKYISISPKIPGEYRWINRKTLQFRPTIQWKPMTDYTISVSNKIKHLYTLMDAPLKTIPENNSNNLSKIKYITLLFENSVNINKLKQAIDIEIRDISGIKNKLTKKLTKEEWTIKQIEQNSAKDNYKYKIIFNKPIKDGHTIYIYIIINLSRYR